MFRIPSGISRIGLKSFRKEGSWAEVLEEQAALVRICLGNFLSRAGKIWSESLEEQTGSELLLEWVGSVGIPSETGRSGIAKIGPHTPLHCTLR